MLLSSSLTFVDKSQACGGIHLIIILAVFHSLLSGVILAIYDMQGQFGEPLQELN